MTATVQTMDRQSVLRATLAQKLQEHSELNVTIDALHAAPAPDMLVLQRLKRLKLAVKDTIARLQDEITPDIIA